MDTYFAQNKNHIPLSPADSAQTVSFGESTSSVESAISSEF
jgi:hypothetical protein